MASMKYEDFAKTVAVALTKATEAKDESLSDTERNAAAAAAADAWSEVPAGVKVMLAAVKHVCGGDLKPSVNALTKTADVSRGTFASKPTWKPLVAAISEHAEVLATSLVGGPGIPENANVDAARLKRERDEAKERLREAQAKIRALESEQAPLIRAVQEMAAAMDLEIEQSKPEPELTGPTGIVT